MDLIGVFNKFRKPKSVEQLVKEIKRMNAKKLVVWFPNDNVLQKLLEYLFDLDASHRFEHVSGARDIAPILVNAFGIPTKVKRYNMITYLAMFDLTKIEEQKKCFNYTNLQPLWAEQNLSKGSRYL